MPYNTNIEPLAPVLAEELDDRDFIKDADGYRLRNPVLPITERTSMTMQKHDYTWPAYTIEQFQLQDPTEYPGSVVAGEFVFPKDGLWNIGFTSTATKNGTFESGSGTTEDSANVFVTVIDADGYYMAHREYGFPAIRPEGPWAAATVYINTFNTVRVKAGAIYRVRIRFNAPDYRPLLDYPDTTNLQVLFMGP